MNISFPQFVSHAVGRSLPLAAGILALFPQASDAFPPAPTHRLFGLVRNEYGEPITLAGARLLFEASNGQSAEVPIVSGVTPGINYSLNLPMDSGSAPDRYKPTALNPTLPFRIRVKIGATTYLPIEMSGSYASLGKPAGSTRIDLTLGEDSDNDGLPDAWERILLGLRGSGTLADIRPEDDEDGDGINNLNEYLAGTFAFDPSDGFRLNLIPRDNGTAFLEFTVIKPRTYTLFSSTDLVHWSPLSFTLDNGGQSEPTRQNYTATDVRLLRVEPQHPAGPTRTNYFYKAQVQ